MKISAHAASGTAPAPRLLLAYGLGLAGVVIFGATLPVTRIALDGFSPWFLTFARAFLASICAAGALLAAGRRLAHDANARLFVAGLFLIFGFPGFMALALQSVPAAHGGVVLGFLPLATAAIASLFAGERHGVLFWLLSATGGAIVVAFMFAGTNGQQHESAGLSIGDAYLVIAGLCASSGYVISGKLARAMPGWEVICRALVLNLPLIAAGTIWTYEPRFADAGAVPLAAMAYLGLGSMFLGFFAWNSAMALGGIGRIGQIQLLQTFVTIALSALLLGETITLATWGTAMAVTLIIALTRRL